VGDTAVGVTEREAERLRESVTLRVKERVAQALGVSEMVGVPVELSVAVRVAVRAGEILPEPVWERVAVVDCVAADRVAVLVSEMVFVVVREAVVLAVAAERVAVFVSERVEVPEAQIEKDSLGEFEWEVEREGVGVPVRHRVGVKETEEEGVLVRHRVALGVLVRHRVGLGVKVPDADMESVLERLREGVEVEQGEKVALPEALVERETVRELEGERLLETVSA